MLASGDPIYRIIGSLSGIYLKILLQLSTIFHILVLIIPVNLFIGTLGYVMSEVEDGKSFSKVVLAAKSLGYTEPGKTYNVFPKF